MKNFIMQHNTNLNFQLISDDSFYLKIRFEFMAISLLRNSKIYSFTSHGNNN